MQDNYKELRIRFEEFWLEQEEFNINSQAIADFFINELKSQKEKDKMELVINENTSDGYHTFKELYEYRKLYNAGLFNEWAKQNLYNVHKSERHSDGEQCFGGGWFIVVATLPSGDISNHYEMEDWNLFDCEIREKAKEWDGHTPEDVANRLREFIKR